MRPFIGLLTILAVLPAHAGEWQTILKKDRAVLEARIDQIQAEARQTLTDLPAHPQEVKAHPGCAPAEIEQRKNSAIVLTTEAYLTILEETRQRLTRKGAEEEAQAIQAEIQRARTTPAYVNACQALQAPGLTWSTTDTTLRSTTGATLTATSPAWNPTREFSATNNPSGAWSYGWTPSLGGAFTLLRTHRTEPNLDGWLKGEPDYPAVWLNHTNRVYDGVRPGELSLHPNLSSECAVLRWTAPRTGRIALKGTFGAGDTGAMNVYVLHNQTPCFQALETRRDEPFTIELPVVTGDRVDFVVGPGRAGHGWGNIPITVAISVN